MPQITPPRSLYVSVVHAVDIARTLKPIDVDVLVALAMLAVVSTETIVRVHAAQLVCLRSALVKATQKLHEAP